jgi:hypothetical protein
MTSTKIDKDNVYIYLKLIWILYLTFIIILLKF